MLGKGKDASVYVLMRQQKHKKRPPKGMVIVTNYELDLKPDS
jgi:hypothetical protein